MFIAFEGADGAGKTTQAALLVDRLRAIGRDVIAVHEPGGTELGEEVRALLLRRGRAPIDAVAEALLFNACRAQLMVEVVEPALLRGAVVVADRFSDSTLAYQGSGRGLPVEPLRQMIDLATRGRLPDLRILLDLTPAQGLDRLRPFASQPSHKTDGSSAAWSRYEDEGIGLQSRVRAGYRELAAASPELWCVVDASAAVEVVAEAVWQSVQPRLLAAGRLA